MLLDLCKAHGLGSLIKVAPQNIFVRWSTFDSFPAICNMTITKVRVAGTHIDKESLVLKKRKIDIESFITRSIQSTASKLMALVATLTSHDHFMCINQYDSGHDKLL